MVLLVLTIKHIILQYEPTLGSQRAHTHTKYYILKSYSYQ